MGHGPALQRSTNEKYAAFLYEFSRTKSATYRGAQSFLDHYGDPDYNAIDLTDYDTLQTVYSLLWTGGTVAAGQPVADWGQSKEEYARLFLAADALARMSTVSKVKPALTHLKIQIGLTAQEWEIPQKPTAANSSEANLKGEYDDEVQIQGSAPELFMLFVAQRFHSAFKTSDYNDRPLGLAIDLASLLIPSVLFRAKAICGLERPYEVDPLLKVATDRPEHSSWPGGHAFWGGAIAVLIFNALSPKVTDAVALWDQLRRAAARMAGNRVRAGLHWKIDSEHGFAQGKFAMEQWLLRSRDAYLANGHPGDAGDLWRLIKDV